MAEARESLIFMEEFDFHKSLKLLVEGHNSGHFGTALKRHLKDFVPAVFKNPGEPDPLVENRLSQKLIFNLFNHFICGDGDPDEVFQELKKLESPAALCAKVFKLGEPTYSCRDCGMDPTCVLCVECFQNSAHKHHRYKMSTSSGGGYCDCGDSEAWKSEPFCDVHRPGQAQGNSMESPSKELLKPDMIARLESLFVHLTDYILEVILWPDPVELPVDLHCPVAPAQWISVFITMLFNDEVHSYEQVTSALTKAINCSQTTAIDLATTVDREGKSIVKIGSKSECEHVKRIIEQATSRRIYNPSQEGTPLLVKVMSPFVVAHHSFAMKAIQWLRQLLNTYGVLRELYSEVALRPLKEDGASFVELCMLNETKMWKSARIQTRQLFLTGLFMNPRFKREFAIIYTKVYDQVVEAYIRDDHDHSYSVTSESVQIFTVPSLHYRSLLGGFVSEDTHDRKVSYLLASIQIFPVPSLARMLITDHNLLKVILDALYKECALKVKENASVMSFDNQESNIKFSRIYSAIYDLKYALLVKPEPHEWSDKLRKNFLEGFKVVTDILKLMQGMDANLRQVDAHIEYEQEWETGFNFQLRLVEVYALLVEWCKSDSQVLVECIHLLVTAIKSRSCTVKQVETARIAGSSSDCFRMDFTTDSVSIHSPLTRLLSSLLACHNSLPWSFTIQLLESLMAQEETSIKDLLEPCLKAVVFVGQVNAGMWRRNGFSLQSQVYFYHNIKCRSTMFDKDLLFLQIAASIIPNNDFLVQFVHSFGLINWSKTEYDTESTPDDSMKHVISLAETLLNWLINIYCERYTVGVGDVTPGDIQKYEVVHCLCIQPMSHSELLDSVSCTSNSEKEKCLEELIKEVATFKKPTSGLGKGLYELKDEFYSFYNPYFYHYTKSNRAKSEENVKKYLKNKGLSTVIQPPSAPLPEFVGMFQNIPNLLHSDAFMHVVRLVLTRSTARWSKSWSEMQLEKVLFLMEFALREEEQKRERGDESFEFVKKAMDGSLSPLSVVQIMENLLAHPPFAQNSLRDMMASIHERTLALAHGGGQTKMDEGCDTTSGSPGSVKDGKKNLKTTEKAKKRREKIMAQMAKMQRNFIKENQELFESTSTRNSLSSSMDQSSMDESSSLSAEVPMTHPVALGLRKSSASAIIGRQTCILCQEDQDVVHNEKALVYCTYMQKSTVLSTDRSKPLDLKVAQGTDPLFSDVTLNFGLHTSTCGHVMHADCWKSFFDALKQRENRRVTRHSFNVKRDEFLCPMCETISNTVLPLISPLSLVASKESDEKKVDLSLEEWLDGILKTVENSIRQEKDRESRDESFFLVPCPLSTVTKMMAEGVAQRFQYIFDYIADDNSSAFSDSIVDMLKKFSVDAFKESLDEDSGDDDRVPVALWNTCSHTILAAENLLRFDDKPLFGSLPSKQAECMGNLIRLAAVSSNFFPMEAIKKNCIRLLSVLVCHSANPHDPDLMNFDLFHALVSVCLSLPTLYREGGSDSGRNIVVPTGHVNESNLLQLVLSCHLLQIFLAIDTKTEEETRSEGDPMETEESSSTGELLEICQHFRSLAGLPPTTMDLVTLQKHVHVSCLPFLRSSALFFHYLTGVPVPLELFQKSSDELVSICEYLDLPSDFSQLFTKSKLLQSILSGWCRELMVNPDNSAVSFRGGRRQTPGQSSSEGLESNALSRVRFPRKVNQLLDLPVNYSDLINQSSVFTCPRSNSSDESKTPALCLVCGKTVCSQSYCCQVKFEARRTIGAAMAHAYTCCGGVGIFLRVRDCQVMLIAGIDKACFVPPPYLDEYGETDEGLRRGNPLTLCQERYKNLQRMWLNHSIAMELVHRVENPIHPQVLMSPVDINHL